MASRFVVCKDREEAITMLEAGLLWLNWGWGRVEPAKERHRWIVKRYVTTDTDVWVAEDFTYLIEEDL